MFNVLLWCDVTVCNNSFKFSYINNRMIISKSIHADHRLGPSLHYYSIHLSPICMPAQSCHAALHMITLHDAVFCHKGELGEWMLL